ncbi:MAG: acyltransferase [Eubacteriales bacterium]
MVDSKKRQANFELLRIVAMLMVITLHYLTKGGVVISYAQNNSFINCVACFIQAFATVAVNVYILISGYFLVDKEFKVGRVITLICQVLFYSYFVMIVLAVLGIVDMSTWSFYDLLVVIFPILMEQYWFATAYVVMALFGPVVAVGIKHIDKSQLQLVIGSLLVLFSVGKTIIPVNLTTDNYGYDYGWFLCLFLIAGYIKMYGIPFFSSMKKSFLIYVLCSICIFVAGIMVGILVRVTGSFSEYQNSVYHYNYILVLISAIALFYGFSFIKIKEGLFSKVIIKIAPFTFGVYLLHEHIAVRDIWSNWLQVEKYKDSLLFIPHMIFCVIVIFCIGILVDYVRQWFFVFVKEKLPH